MKLPFASLLLIACSATVSTATDFTVTTIDDEPYDGGNDIAERNDGNGLSLREAIGIANANLPGGMAAGFGEEDGDQIGIDPSLFVTAPFSPPTLALTAEIQITDDITISGRFTGTGVNGLITDAIISGGSTTRIFSIDTSSAPGETTIVLADLRLTAGNAGDSPGGAILLSENSILECSQLEIDNCSAADGGAIYNLGGTVTSSSLDITSCHATADSGSGGAIFSSGTLILQRSMMTGNTATRAGGAFEIREGSSTTLNSVFFTDNVASSNPGNGGALHITGEADVALNRCRSLWKQRCLRRRRLLERCGHPYHRRRFHD